jgi:hypothetical protein
MTIPYSLATGLDTPLALALDQILEKEQPLCLSNYGVDRLMCCSASNPWLRAPPHLC